MKLSAEQKSQLRSDVNAAIRLHYPGYDGSLDKVFDERASNIVSEVEKVNFLREPKGSAQIVAALVAYRLRIAGGVRDAVASKSLVAPVDTLRARRLGVSRQFDLDTRLYADIAVNLLDLEK